MKRWRLAAAAALALAAMLVPEALEAQCPMCRTALSSPEGQAMVRGFNHAILLLLAAPFALVGTVALSIFRASRVAEARRLQTPGGSASGRRSDG